MEYLTMKVFGSVQAWHLVAGGAGLILFFRVFSAVTRRKPTTQATVSARCGCGWKGQASRFTRQCPRCGNPLA